jgi:hypothetical protein
MRNFEVVSENSYLYGTLVLGIRSSQKANETFAIILRRRSEQATGWAIQSSNPGRGNIFLSSATSKPALGSPTEWVLGFFAKGGGKTTVA